MKKVFICIITILCVAVTLCSCDNKPKTLDTPTELAISDDGVITWEAVENATSYVVYIDEFEFATETNSYTVADLSKSFNYAVKAKADGYQDSEKSEVKTYNYVPKPTPPKYDVTVGIDGTSEIRSGSSASYVAKVTGSDNKEVVWKIVKGSEYASVDENGTVTANEVDGDKTFVLRATSKADGVSKGEKVVGIVAKPVLTQAMLDVFKDAKKISFEGYMSIEVYSKGLTSELQKTFVSTIKTAMDDEKHWYAEYADPTTGITQGLYYTEHNGYACEVGLSLMNDQRYYPLTDDDGMQTTWEKAGLYNSLGGLSVSDFEFDEEEWRYVYKYKNTPAVTKMIASSNPYDFKTETFGLIIDAGEVIGIHSRSKADYDVVEGYVSYEELFVAINYSDTVDVPSVPTYAYEKDVHDDLKAAIENMRALESYTLDFNELTYYLTTASFNNVGFIETITDDTCYFVPYTSGTSTTGEAIKTQRPEDAYGYKKIRDNLYNSFSRGDSGYSASRAFTGTFGNAKPSFMFAPEIFRSYVKDEEKGTTTYYVESIMCSVATTYYYGVGNDINLYGIYASTGYTSQGAYYPYVTVKEVDGKMYITEAGFYYYLGYMYGYITISYSNFDKANIQGALPEGTESVEFAVREVPVSWNDKNISVQVSEESTSLDDDKSIPAKAYFSEFFGATKTELDTVTVTDGVARWTAKENAAFYLVEVYEKVYDKKGKEKESCIGYVVDAETLNYDTKFEDESISRVRVYAFDEDRSDTMPFLGEALGDTFGFALNGKRLRSGSNIMTNVIQFYYDVPLDIDYSIDTSLFKIKEYLVSKGFVANKNGEFIKDGVIVQPLDVDLDLIVYVWYEPEA